VQFSDEGQYLLRCTVTNEVGVASAELTVFVTPVPTWFETRIAFTNYSRTEPLTNFPVLVVLGTNVPGFSYAQFRTPDGSDLRFFDAAGLAELNFEIETWNTNGSSFVWVQVPLFTNQCSIRARWGDPAVTDPPVGAGTGATWSEDYLGVWHLAETSGAHYDSSPALAASRFVSASQQGTATGIAGGADNFDGTNNYVSLPDMGTAPFVTVEAWVKLNGTPSGGDIGLVSSDGWSAGITHFKTSSTRNLKAQFYGGSPVVSSASVVTIGGWAHVAYTIGGVGATDLRLYLNGALLATAAGTANNVLTDVNLAREYNGRYLNARMDEVRISSVARSSNWLWATSQTIASNSVFNSYRSVVPPITIIPPNPILSSPTVVGGQFQFTMNGTPGYLHTIQASTNLTTWNDLYQWTPLTMPVVFAETNLSTFTKRFYRVIISP
jgi:hypothetical protein